MRKSTWCLKCVGKVTGGTKNVDGINRGKYGKENTNWKGGKPSIYLNKKAARVYLSQSIKGKTINRLRYRVIIEKYLERKLSSNEIVHHIDHDSTNDDVSNLFILSRSEHQSLHRRGLI